MFPYMHCRTSHYLHILYFHRNGLCCIWILFHSVSAESVRNYHVVVSTISSGAMASDSEVWGAREWDNEQNIRRKKIQIDFRWNFTASKANAKVVDAQESIEFAYFVIRKWNFPEKLCSQIVGRNDKCQLTLRCYSSVMESLTERTDFSSFRI